MNLVMLINENQAGLLEGIHPNSFGLEGSNLFDTFDLHNHTIADFLDYLEFMDCEHYTFLAFGQVKRLIKLVDYLNRHSDIQFHVYDHQFTLLAGNGEVDLEKYKELDWEKIQSNPVVDRSELQLENGMKALISGLYPAGLNPNLLKHVYIHNPSLLKSISSTVIENMGMNSCIYCKDLHLVSEEVRNDFPVPLYDAEAVEEFIKNHSFTRITKNKLMHVAKSFRENGKVTKDSNLTGFLDYSTAANFNHRNRLVYDHDGIYSDFSRQEKLSEDPGASYREITLVNGKDENDPTFAPIKVMYPNLLILMQALQGTECTFVTPFNQHAFPPAELVSSFKFIGIVKDDEQICYSMSSGQFFKINEVFLVLLEADMKGLLHSEEVKDRLKSDYDRLLSQYRGLIDHAQ
ncbi:hypothetical protein M3181_18545 [Mesobacillus maritimus]|uniref:hypothetical protein n=1 Tax=Mesobacillus maritimus TaxID=1643336 RepID=UPI00203FA602|nr:hypothetical protein [Mesobacillus maritimus]MCM3670964.1 hypothetical protein [Mesobacillus maritimus]